MGVAGAGHPAGRRHGTDNTLKYSVETADYRDVDAVVQFERFLIPVFGRRQRPADLEIAAGRAARPPMQRMIDT